jgi:hypothetical protein
VKPKSLVERARLFAYFVYPFYISTGSLDCHFKLFLCNVCAKEAIVKSPHHPLHFFCPEEPELHSMDAATQL